MPNYGQWQYHQCAQCRLIFLDPKFHLSIPQEKARYDFHQNHPDDQGYVDFLNQLINPLVDRLDPKAIGLDYGCGPGPTVSVIMQRSGFTVTNYDPIYFPEREYLNQTYDFWTCTEAIEHFYHPRKEFDVFQSGVREGGYIGLMTGMYTTIEEFKSWWYHSEPTHVCFYHPHTFEWMAQLYNWRIEYLTDRVVIYMKSA